MVSLYKDCACCIWYYRHLFDWLWYVLVRENLKRTRDTRIPGFRKAGFQVNMMTTTLLTRQWRRLFLQIWMSYGHTVNRWFIVRPNGAWTVYFRFQLMKFWQEIESFSPYTSNLLESVFFRCAASDVHPCFWRWHAPLEEKENLYLQSWTRSKSGFESGLRFLPFSGLVMVQKAAVGKHSPNTNGHTEVRSLNSSFGNNAIDGYIW